jgi:signal transduction histidine kinase/ActR/RegA family two-component response regulator
VTTRASSERAVVLTPTGRDAAISSALIREAGYLADACEDLAALVREIESGAGLAVIADEAIKTADLRNLTQWLSAQPSWSDFPVILLTRHGGGSERNPAAMRLGQVLGNVTFIERPFHPTTLISVVGSAVRARRRQYQTRAILGELTGERAALAELTATLEQRVEQRSIELLKEVAVREKMQEQLRQAQKMETIGQLTGGVAHDFNNLLMAVMGNLDLLRKRMPDEPRLRRLVDGALQGAQRGASLTQRLLAFARQQDLRAVSVDMKSLMSGMADLLERSLGPRYPLWIIIPDDLPPAQVDANQLENAILNLVINARDAMPDGGPIEVRIDEYLANNDPAVSPGSYLKLSVIDTGSGMTPEVLKRAVEPFYTSKPLGKGTGLGLSMVHGLAVQLGGALQLTSKVGKGTSATLLLPVAQTAPQVAVQAIPVQTDSQPAIILFVDDDPLIAMSTTEMLEDLGHQVIGAGSGPHALDIIRSEQKIDLMMTDHAMPGMTGVELASASRKLRPSLPILLATGYAEMPEGIQLDLPRLTKPYQQDQLRDLLNKMLSEQRQPLAWSVPTT